MLDPLLHYNGSSLQDLTRSLRNPFGPSTSFATTDLYIATPLPLKNVYVGLATETATGETATISYWAGTTEGWVDSVQTQDGTDGLSQSGYIRLQPDPDKAWVRAEDTANITELASVRFFNWFWYRISIPNTPTIDFQWIGHKFCEDADLTRKHPSLANSRAYDAFNKTVDTWEDQIIEATEGTIRDLRARFRMKHAAQLLDESYLRQLCVEKSAAYIYPGLGTAYSDLLSLAQEEYQHILSTNNAPIDLNEDGQNDPDEREAGQFTLRR